MLSSPVRSAARPFEVIPAVDLKDGRCVQLRQGRKEDVIFSSVVDPVHIAEEWALLGATRLHLIDLDAALQERRTNFELVQRIVDSLGARGNTKIQVGGGIRSYETAVQLLELGNGRGVDRIIFGTAALRAPQLIARIVAEFSAARVMVALDVKAGKVAIDGWREMTNIDAREAAKRVEELGAGSLLFTNIDVEGLMQGIEPRIVQAVVNAVRVLVVVAGGVSTADDVQRIKAAGASGVVIGSALYTGKIDFKDLMARYSD